MRLTLILLCALVSPVAAAAPTTAARSTAATPKKKLAFGKVTNVGGRAVLTPTTVPEHRRVELIEAVPSGIADLASPDERGIFDGKLRRGRKAKLSAAHAADKGVALLAMSGALSVPLYMGVFEPGVHFGGTSGGHGVGTSTSSSPAIVFAPGVMDGDNVSIKCMGEFPGQVDVRVMHVTATTTNAVEHVLDGSPGELEFVVPTAAMTEGIAIASLRSSVGRARLQKCVVEREAP